MGLKWIRNFIKGRFQTNNLHHKLAKTQNVYLLMGVIKFRIMRILFKSLYLLTLSVMIISCGNESSGVQDQSLTSDGFATKTFDTYQDVSTKEITKEDIRYSVFKEKDGFLNAKFEVIVDTKEEIEMDSFVQNETIDDDSNNRDGKWFCENEINKCLKNGQDALIS